jgi:PAS domain S-box-containing protein
LLKVGQLSNEARDAEAFWLSIHDAIQPYEYDFPAAILYSHCDLNTPDSTISSKAISQQCVLRWTIGYAANHPAIPKLVDLGDDHALARAISNSAKNEMATLYRDEDDMLPESLFKDIEKRGFGDPCKAILIIPIRTSSETTTGYILTGVNTRRPYDAEYQEWIEVLTNLLGASAAFVALHEDEVHRRERQEEQAVREREELSAEVAVLAQEANDVAEKLQNFHDIANAVGLGYFEFGINGQLMHANVCASPIFTPTQLITEQEAFFTQTRHQRDLPNAPPFAFLEHVYPPDLTLAMDKWHTSSNGEPVTYEMRWKKKPKKDVGSEEDTRDYLWTLTACIPIKADDGTVTGIFGCNTDISAQKEATRTAILRAEAERRLASFAETAPVGVYQCDKDLKIEYCNSHWFKILGHPKAPLGELDWRSTVYDDDLEGIAEDTKIVLRGGKPHTFSFRAKKLWTGPDDVARPTWILATAIGHIDDTGQVRSIMGTLTDVSQLKWAEAIQRNRVEEALESKRQQENFIDMTSHEMRTYPIVTECWIRSMQTNIPLGNPLSAMVQCADSVSSSLAEIQTLTNDENLIAQPALRTRLQDSISTSLDAIDTIQACATHQKRIVDDILTLSKLDSKLLVISPVAIQPAALLQDTHKIFKEEASKAQVDLKMKYDASFADMQIDYAILDPSRVLQVLINLLTNAIKFTQAQSTRKVEVTMGASREPGEKRDIQYVPQKALRQDFLNQREWGDGEIFYLHFTVKDTGCGLTAEHKDKLFLRFSQASPRTHVQVMSVLFHPLCIAYIY